MQGKRKVFNRDYKPQSTSTMHQRSANMNNYSFREKNMSFKTSQVGNFILSEKSKYSSKPNRASSSTEGSLPREVN